MSPFLVEELPLYRRSLPHAPAPDELVLVTREGLQRTRHNLDNNVLKPVVDRANERRLARGDAPLPPNITPHTLRRTFVTMSSQRGKSLSWVVDQIGHHDFTTTHRYYLQATSRETQPAIRRHLGLLFETRRLHGAGVERLLRAHDVDRTLTTDRETQARAGWGAVQAA